jgi:uncharacterized membrane protein
VIRLRSLLSDVVGVIGRLGVAGAILIAAVFVFGVLAGAVVVHRLDTAPTADVQEQGQQDSKGEDKAQAKPKHPNNGHGQGQGNKAATEKETPEND